MRLERPVFPEVRHPNATASLDCKQPCVSSSLFDSDYEAYKVTEKQSEGFLPAILENRCFSESGDPTRIGAYLAVHENEVELLPAGPIGVEQNRQGLLPVARRFNARAQLL